MKRLYIATDDGTLAPVEDLGEPLDLDAYDLDDPLHRAIVIQATREAVARLAQEKEPTQ